MGDPGIAEKLVDALFLPHEGRPGELRPVHAIGIGAKGYFVASEVARDYCIAEHFEGQKVPVTVRFSNGLGSCVPHDGWSDVRGMATRFHLGGEGDSERATDLIAMTLGAFFTPTPETFLAFVDATNPKPPKPKLDVPRETAWQKLCAMLHLLVPSRDPYPGEPDRRDSCPDSGAITFANQNSYAQLPVSQVAAIGAPTSYVRASYHAVHTFVVTAADGFKRWVRFTWQPVTGVQRVEHSELWTKYDKAPEDEYLQQELYDRLANAPARFILMMTIGETGDAFDDPTRPWPPHRVRVVMGTLILDEVAKDQHADCERLSFNPCRLVAGMDASEDPILLNRWKAYEYSRKLRGGAACPFSYPFSGG